MKTDKKDCIHYNWNYEWAAHYKMPACTLNNKAKEPYCSNCVFYKKATETQTKD